ncbi:hypothetical protein H5410_006843 [Solanum commersonii]|uniref:Uncharacterized protein n=1 Tax=Solanum commersonii TaxID=4109 RepID=A0A9J6AAY1_SOLCO|nr:hypothetical protein H5410_006843 [Solanum commersonii]
MLKDFLATYKNQDISYTFINEPISRDINALIEMKQKHVDYLQLEIFNKREVITPYLSRNIFLLMNFLDFFDKDLVTILPLIRDLKELILWKIIGMMIDIHKKELHHQYIRKIFRKVIHYMLNYKKRNDISLRKLDIREEKNLGRYSEVFS